MLDQSASGCCQDFAVVDPSFLAGPVASQPLGTIDDCIEGYIDALLPQPITKRRVVVAGDGQTAILDDLLLPEQLEFDLGLDINRQSAGSVPLVRDGERIRVFPVLAYKGEETGSADAQEVLYSGGRHHALAVSLKQDTYLLIAEPLVQLNYMEPPIVDVD